uniref:Uncharacterized protein n=1 Tax=Cannabis sativa TaxID=3483 RepID=A0A803Q819_CANSA
MYFGPLAFLGCLHLPIYILNLHKTPSIFLLHLLPWLQGLGTPWPPLLSPNLPPISSHELSSAETIIADVEAPPSLPPTAPLSSDTIGAPLPLSDPPTSGVFGSGHVADLPISGMIRPPSTAPISSSMASAPSFSASLPYNLLLPFSTTTTTPTVQQTTPFSSTATISARTIGQSIPATFGQSNPSFLGGNIPNLGHQGHVPFNDNSLFTANHGFSRAVLYRPSHDERTPLHLGTGYHPNNLIASFLLTGQENFQSWKRTTSINIAA